MSAGCMLGLLLVAVFSYTSQTAPSVGWVKIKGALPQLSDGRMMVECRAPGGTKLEWLRGEQLRDNSSTVTIGVTDTGETVSYLLVDTQTDYGGTYRCRQVTKPQVEDSITLNRHHHINKNKVTITPHNLIVAEGDRFSLQCQGPNELQWRFNDELVAINDLRLLVSRWREDDGTSELHKSTLTVEEAETEFFGNYTCTDITDGHNHDSVQVRIAEEAQDDRVRITMPTNGINVTEGDTVTIVCQGGKEASLFWMFNEEMLRPSDDVTMMTTMTMSGEQIMAISVAEASASWSGVYACMDHNDITNMDSVWVHIFNNVSDDRVKITSPTDDMDVTEGDTVTIVCRGGRESSLFWMFNGKTLLPSNDITMMTTITMSGEQMTAISLVSASTSWSGVYACMDNTDVTNMDSIQVHVSRNISEMHVHITSARRLDVAPGGSFTVQCEAGPSATLYWTLNAQRLDTTENLRIVTTKTRSGNQVTSVIVTSANVTSAGVYNCRDYKDALNGDSVSVTVRPMEVKGDRVRVLSPRAARLHVLPGDPFTLVCAGPTTTRPTWFHDDKPLGYQPNLLVTHTMDVITRDLVVVLTRLSPDGAASGVYACRDGEGEDEVEVGGGGQEDLGVDERRVVFVGDGVKRGVDHRVRIDV